MKCELDGCRERQAFGASADDGLQQPLGFEDMIGCDDGNLRRNAGGTRGDDGSIGDGGRWEVGGSKEAVWWRRWMEGRGRLDGAGDRLAKGRWCAGLISEANACTILTTPSRHR